MPTGSPEDIAAISWPAWSAGIPIPGIAPLSCAGAGCAGPIGIAMPLMSWPWWPLVAVAGFAGAAEAGFVTGWLLRGAGVAGLGFGLVLDFGLAVGFAEGILMPCMSCIE